MTGAPISTPVHRDHADAAACRRLWAAVLLTAYNDWWRATKRAKDAEAVEHIRAEALRYFRGRNGKEVCELAGIIASPERLAGVAVDLTAVERTKKLLDVGDLTAVERTKKLLDVGDEAAE